MLKEERFKIILDQLKSEQKVTYENLAVELKVSEDTVRRDIDILHKNGLLSKVRGGAIVREKDPLSFKDRKAFYTDEKNVVALKSQQFIKKGMTIFMDGGTTICAVASFLVSDINIRIVTNNYSLIPVLHQYKNIEIILLGGSYDTELALTYGATTCAQIQGYIADLYLMGTCAIDTQFGVTAVSINDVETKKAMIKSSKMIVSLANGSKLRRTETFKVCNISNVDVIITDLPSDSVELDTFRNSGIQIL